MIRTFDHIPDLPKDRTAIQISYTGATLPDSCSLQQYECPILDQGPYGACGGHGSAQGLYIRCNVLGKPLGWIPSPAEIYAASRAYTRGKQSGQLPSLVDNGVQPADMMQAISTIGICPMQEAQTPDGRRSDVDANTVNKELSLALIEQSGLKVPVGEYRLDPKSPSFIEDVCVQLSRGIPVGMGIWVDAAFQAYDGTAPLNTVDLNDPNGGLHWICAVAYRTDPTLGRIVKIVNSWGDAWGDGAGHCELTGSRLSISTTDCYPFDVRFA